MLPANYIIEVYKMLVDANVTIAYKCSSCGTFEFFNLTIFNLAYKKQYVLKCKCGESYVTLTRESARDYSIGIPCIGCGNEHKYILSRKEILNRNINIFNCPEKGIQQCFLGNDEAVRKKVDMLEKEMDELISMFGYDNYFSNTQVMFDALNKIHDIAEQGNLHCECGSDNVELIMLPDKIKLVCCKCSGNEIISAASNEDLKDILTKSQIMLSEGFSDGFTGPRRLVRKTGRK